MTDISRRPAPTESAPYYGRYIGLVPDGPIVAALERQGRETEAFLRSISEERSLHRYAEGKWSIREVVGHVTDAERVFAFRALAFARADANRFPGFDEGPWVSAAQFDRVPWGELVDGYASVRRASVLLFGSMDEEAWRRTGIASDAGVSVLALAYIIAGHEQHHLRVIRERYLS